MSYESWKNDVSAGAKETLSDLGGFSPTVRFYELKGYMHDDDGGGKVYWSADDLRKMAAHFIEVSDWMDKHS